jgi:hypothetical protein
MCTCHGIPRTTADRLVARHEKLIGQNGNGTDGAIKALTNEEIDQAAKATWSKLQGKLGTHQAKYRFFSRLIVESGTPFEQFDDGVLILIPPPAQEAAAAQAPQERVEVVPEVAGE